MSNVAYIEDLYRQWRQDPAAVANGWDAYFRDAESAPAAPATPAREVPEAARTYKQGRVDSLLWAYRDIGYVYADLNPLGCNYGPEHSYLAGNDLERYEDLTLEEFRLSERDLGTVFHAGRALRPSRAPLRDIIAALRETYCGTIGVEFLHIQDKRIRRWLIRQMESTRNRASLSTEQRRTILEDLLRTEALERALHRYFTGQKRFSLEGSEALIPALHFLVDRAPGVGIEQMAIGTTHRGRLSILNTILEMPPEEIFSRFEETHAPEQAGGSGDVKYHIGYDRVHRNVDGATIRIRVPANASHLESVGPVLEGMARGLQDAGNETDHRRILPVLLHGDAAFSGQGVVSETLNLADLAGYTTGGTIHAIINNQIGFTTSARSARSSVFPTDPAKALQAPIFHVNGDDPEAMVHAMDLALRFRQEFAHDVVVDIFCFRRHGHNEGDDPSFTQPYMYRLIKDHPTVAHLYGERCAAEGVLSRDEQETLAREYAERLKQARERARQGPPATGTDGAEDAEWEGIGRADDGAAPETRVPEDELRRMVTQITTVPDGFHAHPRLKRILDRKREIVAKDGAIDWAQAEALAFGSLLLEGTPVRLCGEDSVRGTFSQRHLAWWDVESATPRDYVPLNELAPDQAPLLAYDSPLSEYSALAFEYGYSLVRPRTLVAWEAQFGDFVNGAQVVIDNYIASAEAKWQQRSGLVLLLPHGDEGQGPDHSCAHAGRFLELCAEGNMEVCNATTPAQYFHLLRRQMRRNFRRPLVIMTPKSLLRHPRAVSPLADLAHGRFEVILDDPNPPEEVACVLFCSGKIFYDLAGARAERDACACAIVRVEQIYPFPLEALRACAARYARARTFVWVQDEPRNAGAWRTVLEQEPFTPDGMALTYVGHDRRASSATGLHKRFVAEQEKLIRRALQYGDTE